MVSKNLHKRILFIGRLEPEKGIEIVRDIIVEIDRMALPYEVHIFGSGSYRTILENLQSSCLVLHGQVSSREILWALPGATAVLMPSLFLETFGLVALEACLAWVPVIGYRKWGLEPFIAPECHLDAERPVESFFQILSSYPLLPCPSVDAYRLSAWRERWSILVWSFQRILFVHDYYEPIGGAEKVVQFMIHETQRQGKAVYQHSYHAPTTTWKKFWMFFILPFAWWRGRQLSKIIHEFQPDLIVSHSVLRAVSPWGMRAVARSGCAHIMMHHDLWLFTPRPSFVRDISDIPPYTLKGWIWGAMNWKERILRMGKYWLTLWYWCYIPKTTRHLVPSAWMLEVVQWRGKAEIFPHTVFDTSEISPQ